MPFKDKEKGLEYQRNYKKDFRKRPEQLKKAQLRRKKSRANIREKLKQLIGDKCIICNSSKRLCFHEIHGIRHKFTLINYIKHPENFIPLCSKHHRKIHFWDLIFRLET